MDFIQYVKVVEIRKQKHKNSSVILSKNYNLVFNFLYISKGGII